MPHGAGSVSSLFDQFYDDLEDGRAFARFAAHTSAAGQFPQIQLFNPAGSARSAHVFLITASSGTTQRFTLVSSSVPLATLDGVGNNLDTSQPDALSEIRRGDTGAAPTTGYLRINSLAETPHIIGPTWLVRLAPGVGVRVAGHVAASALTVSFVWVEHDV